MINKIYRFPKLNVHFRRVLLLLCVLTFLVSCSNDKKISIGVSQNSSDDWRNKMNSEMLLEMYLHPEAELEIRSADNNNEIQISDIEYFIDKGIDVLVVSPREAEAITPVISKAYRKGIKVLVFDRETSNEEYDRFYGADNYLIGYNAGLYAGRYLSPAHNSSAPMEVLEIRGLDGSSPAIGRHKGFIESLGKEPRMKIVESISTDWTPDNVPAAIDTLLRKHPNIELIYAHNDRMAMAASEKARSLGRNDIRVIGIDGAPNIGLDGVSTGLIDATFVYPTNGAEIIQDAIGLARGEKKPKRELSESALAIDKSNVELQLLSAHSLDEALNNLKQLNSRVIAYAQTQHTLSSLLWALIGMLVLTALAAFLILRLYWSRKRTQGILAENNALLRKQRDDFENLNTQLKEATTSKLNFFINVSHDLRTPLTLIASPIESLENAPELTPHSKGLVAVADKNIKILRRLINQILDFQKYESGKLKLNLVSTDICADFRDWTSSFQSAARKKDIRLSLQIHPEETCRTAIDIEKLERIFFNLMSNAFRFTPANGSITVDLDTSASDYFEFSVKDTGRGIPAENIPHLFERFFQGREGNAGGSGIGLVVVKSFVELHGGTIEVESEQGVGTIFRVRLPKRDASEATQTHETILKEGSQVTSKELAADISAEISEVEIPSASDAAEPEDPGKPVVLVVDDNEDLRQVVRSILEKDYHVITAPSGESGLRQAMKYVPDCVLSDVMMQGMDGLELTRRLKNESVTSHIPIILLTACALDEQRAQGYEAGADGYLSKPFNSKVLLSRVTSAINNRKLLKAGAGADVPIPEVSPTPKKKNGGDSQKGQVDPFSELDSTFYRNFVAMVNRDMSDPELSVEEMAARMGMSRVQFYRKLKALTNYSPADLLRLFRLRKSKELLMRSDETTVAEVAYKVGYSSPSYFAKCFKDQFGELPSEYQARTSRIQG